MTEYLSVDASGDDWDVADLDRCRHGRHSIDPCMYCPGGQSIGNQFLDRPVAPHQPIVGLVRIGTNLSGDPIMVRTNRSARMAEPDLRLDHGRVDPILAPGDEITISDRVTGWEGRFRVIEPRDSAVRIEPVQP